MVQICAMNDALTCMRPGMTVNFGFTKWIDDLMSGRNSKPEDFTVYMNSDTKLIFVLKCVWSSDSS